MCSCPFPCKHSRSGGKLDDLLSYQAIQRGSKPRHPVLFRCLSVCFVVMLLLLVDSGCGNGTYQCQDVRGFGRVASLSLRILPRALSSIYAFVLSRQPSLVGYMVTNFCMHPPGRAIGCSPASTLSRRQQCWGCQSWSTGAAYDGSFLKLRNSTLS